MKKALFAACFGMAATSANAAIIISEDFESGPGVFTLNGNALLNTSADYVQCCGTPNDTSNTFVTFGRGNAASGSLATSFDTMLGQLYSVTFNFSALGQGTEPLTFNAGGQSFIFNPVANNNLAFQSGGFSFLGTGGTTNFNVTSAGLNNVDAIVDNITVSNAVPEPATWAMMLLGFGFVGVAMRRRRDENQNKLRLRFSA
ncbi:PEPxxWA-CTERM sorting domain-containing protein [Erythrobacter sp. QSSC1-22B]|uniref:PEPxxWA-CTERM sorting domain-containing protein n=1 Tax=Erythrobacter sp. QSSC1-22B TaxID=1860125 RepID=UPI001F2CD792|nr:PEPxxWA-CTERM sorting domain-containing protein [Erythrobacter sp. QSSC1-22B]